MATGTRGRTTKSRGAKKTVAVSKPTKSDSPAGELKKNLDAVLAENATLRKENERLTGILTDIAGLAGKKPAASARMTKARAPKPAATAAAAPRTRARSTTKLSSTRRAASRRTTKKSANQATVRSSSARARRATTEAPTPAISTATPAAVG